MNNVKKWLHKAFTIVLCVISCVIFVFLLIISGSGRNHVVEIIHVESAEKVCQDHGSWQAIDALENSVKCVDGEKFELITN